MNEFDKLYSHICETQVTESREALRAMLAAGLLAGAPMQDIEAAKKPGVEQAQPSTYKLSQIKNIIARTLWREARGEGEKGMQLVAAVIYNRAQGRPEKFVDVIKKPKQFESWKHMKTSDWLPSKYEIDNEGSGEMWDIAEKIAEQMVKDQFVPINKKYDHFFNPAGASPSWGKKPGYTYKKHKFLDLSKKWDTT